jgi:hypothetical protein
MPQALYQKLLESRIFPSQAEAIEWGKTKREQYKAADMRRLITEVFLKT